jgi:molybdopterin molybdotransferase
MISVAEARELVLAPLLPLACEVVAIDRALGRVLGQNIQARRTQPPADMSAMDGWAIRAADLTSAIKPAGESAAGNPYDHPLPPASAVRIFTGAIVPDGADTIILQEDAELMDANLIIRDVPPMGKHIRRRGLDFSAGDIGLTKGQRLSPRDVALLAAMDIPWVSVYRKPRVAILATGDELVRPGEPLSPGQIIASNHLGVAGLVLEAGGEVIDLGIAPDRADALAELAQGARGADMLVTIGGASVGDHDLVKSSLTTQGMTLAFHKIAMRPGKPLMSGQIGDTPFLGLPGNPVSAIVCGLLFLVPAIQHLSGRTPHLPELFAQTVTALGENDKRADFLRARLTQTDEGLWQAEAFGLQDSSMLTTLARANGLILRAPFAPAVKPGDRVKVLPFDFR